MSEHILKFIIQLFALTARIDGLKPSERDKIISLIRRLYGHKKENEKFIDLFDHYSGHSNHSDPQYQFSSKEKIFEKIISISRSVKGETNLQQRINLISRLIQLIHIDGHMTAPEVQTIEIIGKELNLNSGVIEEMMYFMTSSSLKDFDSDNILILKSDDNGIPNNSHFIRMNNLDGFIAILTIKNIKTLYCRYFGQSVVLHNNLPIEAFKTELLNPGSNLRSDEIDTIYYSEIISRFKEDRVIHDLSFTAKKISFQFGNGKYGLREVDISEPEGKLVGIMGASGSGKSTLINVLNGNAAPTEGTVEINGIDIYKNHNEVKGCIGYVPQDDLLIEDLTVFQNLYYAAKLCFKDKSQDELVKLVDTTLYNLGIYETKDLKVGNALNKTISGGQRKRLNIGLELLREPMIMFVDEPTSGLSSNDSENIMDLLKELTMSGKLIFVVIHQPSSIIYKMFDKLLILDVGGYPVYYGNPIEAIKHFREALKIIDKSNPICLECGNVNPEQVFNIIEQKVVDDYGYPTKERKYQPEFWNNYYKEKTAIKYEKPVTKKPDNSLNIPSLLNQIKIFTTRDFLSKISNRQYVLINLLEAPFLAFILSVFIRHYSSDGFSTSSYVFYENVNIPVYIFMAIIVGLFMGLTVSAEEIISDRQILKRESFLHLSWSGYLSSKLIILFVLSAIQAVSFVLIGNWILQIKGMLLPYWAVVFSVSCFANILGLNISSAFNSVVTIYILIPILLIPQLLLGGVMVKYDDLNPTFTNKARVPVVGDLMAARWAYEALIVTQFRDNDYEKIFYPYDKVIANSNFKTVYHIPALLSKADYIFLHQTDHDAEKLADVNRQMEILKHEINEEITEFGNDKFPHLNHLSLESFDSLVYEETKAFLEVIKKVYVNRQLKATQKKEEIINAMTASPQKINTFEELKKAFTNEQINNIALNNKVSHRIIEDNGELIQKIYPIYMDPDPHHFLDYTSQMYQPKKHFANVNIDTFLFNLLMIWVMTLLLIIALHFKILQRLVHWIEYTNLKK